MSTSSNYDNLVQQLYVTYFGRPADYFGLQNFDQALGNADAPTDAAGLIAAYQSNAAIKTLVDGFGNSAESARLYGSGSTEDFVNAIFKDLFDRPAASAGLSFWSNAIDSGQVSKGLAALTILEGAQQNSSAQGLIDQQAIANKVAVAENFTTSLGASSTEIVAYSGAAAALEARLMLASVGADTNPANFDVQTTINDIISGPPINVYTLTIAPEALVGGPGVNVFNAVLDNAAGLAAGGQVQTLVAGDSITSGSPVNILNLVDFGIGSTLTIPDGVTLNGITQLTFESLESVSGDFSSWSGLTTLEIRYSTGDDAIVAGSQATVSVVDSLGNVSVQGGNNVAVTTDKAHAVSLISSAGSITVVLGDSTNTVVDTAVDVAVNITAGAGANSVTLGAGASGTVSFGAHTAGDAVVLLPSESNPAAVVAIAGLNNSGNDTIRFAGDANTLTGFTQVTAGAVTASGGNTGLLTSWIAVADGAAGGAISGAAHTVTWFVYQGNTYLLESVAGQTTDAGTMAAGNTVVELTGTGYTFSHASGANGTLHLLG